MESDAVRMCALLVALPSVTIVGVGDWLSCTALAWLEALVCRGPAVACTPAVESR